MLMGRIGLIMGLLVAHPALADGLDAFPDIKVISGLEKALILGVLLVALYQIARFIEHYVQHRSAGMGAIMRQKAWQLVLGIALLGVAGWLLLPVLINPTVIWSAPDPANLEIPAEMME